ncbi:phosphatase PAP2 family protein [Pseudonocardia sp.]|uniref:phosphatase PAP2 family protein n=1 Tax=Pseudonocardia sp. TaxID=60912 RepID=UPI003D0FCEEE
MGRAGRGTRTSVPAVIVPAALLVTLATAAVVALWVGASAAGPTPADAAALRESMAVRTTDLTALAIVVTDVGSTVAMAIVALATGAWLVARHRLADAAFVVGAWLGGLALFRGLKILLDRARPPEMDRLVAVADESLPSGHATMATVVIGALVALAWAGRTVASRAALVALAALWIGAVGATRIYLGVHWFTDVVAGWLLGGAWLALCVVAWTWWHQRAPALTAG